MQMNANTNYAIRIVIELSKYGRLSAGELAQRMDVPMPSVMKIMRRLKQTGVVQVKRGNDGGFELVRRGGDITLYDIIEKMEPSIKINRCLEKEKYCSREKVQVCCVRKLYKEMQEQIERELRRYSVAELAVIK